MTGLGLDQLTIGELHALHAELMAEGNRELRALSNVRHMTGPDSRLYVQISDMFDELWDLSKDVWSQIRGDL